MERSERTICASPVPKGNTRLTHQIAFANHVLTTRFAKAATRLRSSQVTGGTRKPQPQQALAPCIAVVCKNYNSNYLIKRWLRLGMLRRLHRKNVQPVHTGCR